MLSCLLLLTGLNRHANLVGSAESPVAAAMSVNPRSDRAFVKYCTVSANCVKTKTLSSRCVSVRSASRALSFASFSGSHVPFWSVNQIEFGVEGVSEKEFYLDLLFAKLARQLA